MPSRQEELEMLAKLPSAYQDGDEVLKIIFAAAAPPLQVAADAITGLAANFNPDTMPDDWLPWALRSLGWPVPGEAWPAYVNRQVLKNRLIWLKEYGKEDELEKIIHAYFTTDASTDPITVTVKKRGEIEEGGFRIGYSRIGGAEPLWNHFSRDYILITVTDAGDYTVNADLLERLHGLADYILPAWMRLEVRDGT